MQIVSVIYVSWGEFALPVGIGALLDVTKLELSRAQHWRGPSVQTIYLQIAAAGGQQLFGRMGGANINYLKQQICVSNTFTKIRSLCFIEIFNKIDRRRILCVHDSLVSAWPVVSAAWRPFAGAVIDSGVDRSCAELRFLVNGSMVLLPNSW